MEGRSQGEVSPGGIAKIANGDDEVLGHGLGRKGFLSNWPGKGRDAKIVEK